MIKQLLQFMQNHWLLCSAFGGVLALLIFEELKEKLTGTAKISIQDATLLLTREHAIVLDCRSQTAFLNGHILNAINIAKADIDQNLQQLASYKNSALILVDDNDKDASAVNAKLREAGFTKIYTLAGGLRAWQDAKLPLNKN